MRGCEAIILPWSKLQFTSALSLWMIFFGGYFQKFWQFTCNIPCQKCAKIIVQSTTTFRKLGVTYLLSGRDFLIWDPLLAMLPGFHDSWCKNWLLLFATLLWHNFLLFVVNFIFSSNFCWGLYHHLKWLLAI